MGRPAHKAKGARTSNKQYRKYSLSTKHRARDVDQIQDDLEIGGRNFVFDEDLPGGGQYYCQETGRHFVDATALRLHRKSREFKRRVKELKEEQYTQNEADLGSGMTREVLPLAHPQDSPTNDTADTSEL